MARRISSRSPPFGAGGAPVRALGLPEVLDDPRVHDANPLARLLARVGREVALDEDLLHHPVGLIQGRIGVVHEGPLYPLPSLFVASKALLGEGTNLALHPLPTLP